MAIKTENLSIGYRSRHGIKSIVHDSLDLELQFGSMTCLLGLNGAGKSTLLRTLCSLQPPVSGSIFICGKNLKEYGVHELSTTIGVVLTDRSNSGGITVRELVCLGRYPYTGFFGRLGVDDERIVEQAMKDADISHKADNHLSELSDGEKQRAFIAKALAQQCPIIILDEPTAFLDVTGRVEIMLLLGRLAKEQGKAILVSTHDLDLALQMADVIWLQKKNSPMRCGAPDELVSNGTLSSFFDREGLRFDPDSGRIVPTCL